MATRNLGLWTFLAVLGASGCSASSDKSSGDDPTGSAGSDTIVGSGGDGSGNTTSGAAGSTSGGGSTGTAGDVSGTGGAAGAGGTAVVGAGGTATGTGGTVNMGGTCANPMMPAGASGPACKLTSVPTAPMIDDMELIHDAQDGQPHGNTDNNIPGHWFVSNDGTNGTWIAPANKWMGYYNVKLDPPREASQQAMFFGGQGFTSWGVALGVGVASCVDASPYMGVSFWAKSTTGSALPVKFDVGTYDVVVSTNGGGCTGACAGKYETVVTIPVEWKQIQIPFCAFAPIGTTIPLAKNKIVNLTFLIAGNVTYQFYIDDISFY